MADADIIARLQLRAGEFVAEFNSAMGALDKKAHSTGQQIASGLGSGIGDFVRNTSSRVPLIGGMLSGISGPAFAAAGSIGVLAAGYGTAITEAEAFMEAQRGLDAVLTATGNKTGIARDALIEYAEEMEGRLAIPAEEIIAAQRALAMFDGVAGTTFRRTIELSADLAASLGGDLPGNAEKLGTVLQNLAQGNVEGLRKGFKTLGTAQLEAIEKMAETGDAAGAIELLLSSLEQRIGPAAEAKSKGLSAAFYKLKDASGDTLRNLALESGAYNETIEMVDALANSVSRFGDSVAEFDAEKWVRMLGTTVGGAALGFISPVPGGLILGGAAGFAAGAALNEQDLENERATKPGRASKLTFDQATGKWSGGNLDKATEDKAAAAAIAAQKAEADKRRTAEAAAVAGKKAADQAERARKEREAETKRLAENYERTMRQMNGEGALLQLRLTGKAAEADAEEAVLKVREQLRGVSAADLKIAEDRARVNAALKQQLDEQEEAQRAAQRASEEALRDQKQAMEELARQQEQDVRDLSEALYEGFLSKGASFWAQFKLLGLKALADLAAVTIVGGRNSPTRESGLLNAIFGGGKKKGDKGGWLGDGDYGDLGGLPQKDGAGAFGKEFSKGFKSVFTDLKKDAKDLFKSIGIDFGEVGGKFAGIADTLGQAAGGAALGAGVGTLQQKLGLGGSKTGGAIGGAIGSALPIPGGEIIGSIIGSTIGGMLKKAPKATASLSTDALGEVEVGKGIGSSKLRAAAEALGNSVASRLQQVADAIDADLRGSVDLGSIGQKGKKFTFDPDGAGPLKAQKFKTAEEAEAAAFKYAIATRDIFIGISDTSRRLLNSAQDVEKALNQVASIESIPKRLRAIEDPTAAALDDLADEFDKLRATLTAAGASAAEMADLEKLYGLERERLAKDQMSALKGFRDDLSMGAGSPLSLRDQRAMAESTFADFERKIMAGDSYDQEGFVDAGRKLLDIEKSLNGSTGSFFSQFDRVRSLTDKAIATQANVDSIAKANADAAAATAKNTAAIADIGTDTVQQLALLRDDIQSFRSLFPSAGGGRSGFLTDTSGFTRAF